MVIRGVTCLYFIRWVLRTVPLDPARVGRMYMMRNATTGVGVPIIDVRVDYPVGIWAALDMFLCKHHQHETC